MPDLANVCAGGDRVYWSAALDKTLLKQLRGVCRKQLFLAFRKSMAEGDYPFDLDDMPLRGVELGWSKGRTRNRANLLYGYRSVGLHTDPDYMAVNHLLFLYNPYPYATRLMTHTQPEMNDSPCLHPHGAGTLLAFNQHKPHGLLHDSNGWDHHPSLLRKWAALTMDSDDILSPKLFVSILQTLATADTINILGYY